MTQRCAARWPRDCGQSGFQGFFPVHHLPAVKGIFQELGFSPAVATILALLCTECPRRRWTTPAGRLFVATGPRGLPQGACTSPALSNLLARRLDARLDRHRQETWFYLYPLRR